ncbi:1-acyl-sn-glycerol-3-phosphate acyltransferase [Flaviaesturariibacter amylovorans]|uniref:Phospholipid/glycerol acyltransferase domain-containing protein n=1 Tax=Flaviaesturariibacter amylovorans TaxID=1084520 RepID=A0ABP8HQ55_9BACT
MLYRLLKIYARGAIRIFCRHIELNRPELLHAEGPLLLAANHPNSFLDGVIMTILLDRPLYSLARGDAFAHPLLRRIMKQLHLLPVYRTSEGVENLQHNYSTFAACQEVFRQKGIVLIFSEGGCVNEWHLRPLRKGTARLALSSWQQGIPLNVIPLGFNYNRFRNFGKNVFIRSGAPIDRAAVEREPTEGKQLLEFNRQLRAQLEELVYEIDPDDRAALRRKVAVPQPLWKRVLLAPPALAGAVLHAPLYFPLKWFTGARFNNDHFDSVLTALLFLLYPFYLLLCFGLATIWLPAGAALSVFILMPFFARATVQLKDQLSS